MRKIETSSHYFGNSSRRDRRARARRRRANAERGQIVVEYMLLMVVVISLASLLTSTLRNAGALKALVFDPFAKFDGMIQCGVWEPCGIARKVRDKHSNSAPRVLSLDPEKGPR